MTKTLSILPGGAYHEHASWFIGPCGVHRDSELIDQANWESMLASYAAADPDQSDYEIHRFGHFAVGWIEEVAYRPGSKVAEVADTLRTQLAGYPILDEELLSQMESDAESENWPSIARDLRRDLLKICTTWEGWTDDHEDMLTDDFLSEHARDRGESSNGYVTYSASDIAAIAESISKPLGFVDVE